MIEDGVEASSLMINLPIEDDRTIINLNIYFVRNKLAPLKWILGSVDYYDLIR